MVETQKRIPNSLGVRTDRLHSLHVLRSLQYNDSPSIVIKRLVLPRGLGGDKGKQRVHESSGLPVASMMDTSASCG